MDFITNHEKFLSEIMKSILPSSENFKALVGFFFYSGFEEIYPALADKEVKILVGLDVDFDMMNRIRQVEVLDDKIRRSRESIRDKYLSNLKDVINETDWLDTKERREAFLFMMEKIQDGSLQIRKTTDPNHAKLYLFRTKDENNQLGTFPGTIITGSSNLTRSGLKTQNEINVISRSSNDYLEMEKLFDSLWEKSIEIFSATKPVPEFISKTWLNQLPSPYHVYIRILKEFFQDNETESIKYPASITKQKMNLRYQMDAIKEGMSIIRKHNGVIIADVVGLGKSIIASAIAHNLDLKTVVICPPHLVKQWDDYRVEFDFNAKVYSCGIIEEVLKENKDEKGKLIIIDEVHRFRNPLTIDYTNLHKLCQGNKVILLSATPYSNAPADIFSLIKLFQIPARSTLQTISNLSYQFQTLIKDYKELSKKQKEKKISPEELKIAIREISSQIRSILYPLVIRRSRIDLDRIQIYREDLKKQKIEFPTVKPPELLTYYLGDLKELYINTLEAIAPDDETKGFQGARYKSVTYLKNIDKYKKQIEGSMGDFDFFTISQINLAKFMRRQLVRRFESSMKAFKISLNSMIQSTEMILDWYDRIGLVPIYKRGHIPSVDDLIDDSECIDTEESTEMNQSREIKKLQEKGYFFIEKKELKLEFREDLIKDLDLLNSISDDWMPIKVSEDAKLIHFKGILKESRKKDPTRKILVFSEFADTVNYLYENMDPDLKVFKYTSADSNKQNKATILENFDASNPIQKDDYQVLIATDAISEGFNLGRAGAVFNYDIPYNPTRVIQRVGRINRISHKMFDELMIYNFFPTEIGEAETRQKQISTLKLAMIQAILGEDTKVLTKDEELLPFIRKQFTEASEEEEQESWDAKYINLLHQIENSSPEEIQQAMSIPKRSRIQRTNRSKKGVLVYGKKGENSVFKFGVDSTNILPIPFEESFVLLEAEPEEKPKEVSNLFDEVYQNLIKNIFRNKISVSLDRPKGESIMKLRAILESYPEGKEYIEDLIYLIKDLDNLPERLEKFIRNLDLDDFKKAYQALIKEIPYSYIEQIIQRADSIEEERESIILSEEFV